MGWPITITCIFVVCLLLLLLPCLQVRIFVPGVAKGSELQDMEVETQASGAEPCWQRGGVRMTALASS